MTMLATARHSIVRSRVLVADLLSRPRAERRVELAIRAHLYRLEQPIRLPPFTRYARRAESAEPRLHTHAVELLLTLTNRGRSCFRLFNAQLGINTLLRPRFDEEDGHLHLNRIFSSGNLVPLEGAAEGWRGQGPYFAIEPGVARTIHYLALIPQPSVLLQVVANLSPEQRRVPIDELKRGLYPFSAVRTYQLTGDGLLAQD